MSALSNAKAYLATLKDDGRTRYDGHPDVLLAALVAEIEAAPVARINRGLTGKGLIVCEVDLEPGKVRLLALDSGGAGEVGNG